MGPLSVNQKTREKAMAVPNAWGFPNPVCLKPGCLEFLSGSACLRSFGRPQQVFCVLAFALLCALLHPTAFRATGLNFGNFSIHFGKSLFRIKKP